MAPPRIDHLLATDNDLQPVVAKAREINALANLCKEFLPPELAAQVRPANLQGAKLVVLGGQLCRGGQAQASFRVVERLLGEARREG
jgi:hypothetical protein